MANFCMTCGTELGATAKFCPKCGASVLQSPEPEASNRSAASSAQYQEPSRASSGASTSGLQSNVAGMLCYVLGLVTGVLFLAIEPYKNDPFVRFHAFQAIIFHVAWIVFWIVRGVLSTTLPWGLQFLISLLNLVIGLGGLLVWLFLMYKAYNNEKFKLPVIGDIASQKAG